MALADDANEPDYGTFGVRAQRTSDPVSPPPIDRQRVYMGAGQDLSMGAKARSKSGGGVTVSTVKPGGFSGRKRTLRKG